MADIADLRIVTLNTWKNEGDYPARLRLMADGLTALRPDVVFLQEVFVAERGFAHTGETVADALGLAHRHIPARAKPRDFAGGRPLSTSGLSILTRLPIAGLRLVPLPSHPDDGERVAQMLVVRWRDRTLTLANVHLTYLDDADDLRREQLRTVREALDPLRGGGTAIIAGDFNADPESPPIRWLLEESGLAVREAGAAAGDERPTFDPTGATAAWTRRIDYIFVIDAEAGPPVEIIDASRVLDGIDPISGTAPSDHAGVFTVLRDRR